MSSPPVERLGLRSRAPDDHGVRIVDTPAVRVHHPADLVGAIAALLGIALVVVLAVYAHRTTSAITDDVQEVAGAVRQFVVFPVAVLEWVITVLAPIAVLAELLWRRLVRQAFEAMAGAVLGYLSAVAAAWLIGNRGIPAMRNEFSVWIEGEWVVTVPPLLAAVAALLTASGERARRRTAGWSWNFLWLVLGVAVITGLLTLPGALLSVLIGRAAGLALRYAFGVHSERAYGRALVEGVRRAGFEPRRLVRVRDVGAEGNDTAELATDLAAVAITRVSDNRVYAMTTTEGDRLDVVVLDGDRQVVGTLTRFWRSMRLRGIEGRAVVSLRQAAERAALLGYAAWSAGVCTPRLLGMAEAEDSMLLIQQHSRGAVPLRDLPPEALTDDVLDAVWEQLAVAHGAGLAHRAITSDVVLVNSDPDACPPDAPANRAPHRGPVVLLTGWEYGDVASAELARRLDVATMLTVLALKVGPERAVASAVRTGPDGLATIGPLLQPIAFPRATREEARGQRGVMGDLREALLARLPQAVVEPERLVRFGARTVLMLVLGIVAAFAIITSLNLEETLDALRRASPWWALAAFGLGLSTFLGSAITVSAFSPVKLSFWRVTQVQAAAAYVSLAAPAAVGPAALNLRMLTRRGVSNALAAASVGLVQLVQLVATVGLLVGLSAVSGTDVPIGEGLPSRTILVAIVVVALAVTAAMLVPALRQWVVAKILPVWQTTWPRFVQLLGQPRRFLVALGGSLMMTLGYLGGFWASLAAFGQADRVSLIDLALVYLLGNAAGAMLPTPGGLGGVEAALTLGLTGGTAVAAALAAPIVVVFRLVTFWARIPVGWLAMRRLQRAGVL